MSRTLTVVVDDGKTDVYNQCMLSRSEFYNVAPASRPLGFPIPLGDLVGPGQGGYTYVFDSSVSVVPSKSNGTQYATVRPTSVSGAVDEGLLVIDRDRTVAPASPLETLKTTVVPVAGRPRLGAPGSEPTRTYAAATVERDDSAATGPWTDVIVMYRSQYNNTTG